MTRHACFIALALGLLLPQTARAAESFDSCTGYIDAVPAVISTQGTWCMRKDLSTAISSGSAILIDTSNVILDCNEFKLGGLAAGAQTLARGVRSIDRNNVVVRRCNVRGFHLGIDVGGANAGGVVVQDNRLDGNRHYGINIASSPGLVRGNLVMDTGLSGLNLDATAIGAFGSVDIIDNTISGVDTGNASEGLIATGIRALAGNGNSLAGNRVREIIPPDSGATSAALAVFSGARVAIRNNDLAGVGAAGSEAGLVCVNSTAAVIGNTVQGFFTNNSGCPDDGGNAFKP